MKRFLYIFLASLILPFINENLWKLSGINFWANYVLISIIAFLGLSVFFNPFTKNKTTCHENKK